MNSPDWTLSYLKLSVSHFLHQVLTAPRGDVVDILSTDSRFSTLVSLLKQAGIADSLQLSGPFTVFAPTNQVRKHIIFDRCYTYAVTRF